MEDLNLSDSKLAKLILQAAVNKTMERLSVFKYLAFIFLWLGVIAAGIEPMSYPWVRLGLAGILAVAYLGTLHHIRTEQKKEE